MSEVFKIGITDKNNQQIKEVNSINVLADKGILGDRHFQEFNDPFNQLSLIESALNAKSGARSTLLVSSKRIPKNGMTIVNETKEKIILKILNKIFNEAYIEYGLI